jgi:hypothetical protein
MLASGEPGARAFAQASWGLPAEVRERWGVVCQSPWEMPTPLGRGAGRPGAFPQRAPGMGMAGCGDGPRPASLPTGGYRRGQAHSGHALSGRLNAGQGAAGGPGGHSAGARHAAQGLQRCAHRGEAPGGARRLARLGEPLAACGGLVDRADRCVQDHGRRWGRTDHG